MVRVLLIIIVIAMENVLAKKILLGISATNVQVDSMDSQVVKVLIKIMFNYFSSTFEKSPTRIDYYICESEYTRFQSKGNLQTVVIKLLTSKSADICTK